MNHRSNKAPINGDQPRPRSQTSAMSNNKDQASPQLKPREHPQHYARVLGSQRSVSSDGSSHSGGHSVDRSTAKRSRVRFASPVDARSLAKIATKSGFLKKQADNEQGVWNKYFFVVKPHTYLYYYNSLEDEKPRGVIDLEFLKDVKLNQDCKQKCKGGSEHSFRVSGFLPPGEREKTDRPNLRPLFLDSASVEETEAWMEAIELHRFKLSSLERPSVSTDGTFMLEQRLREAENQIQQLQDENARLATQANEIRQQAKRSLDELRGVEVPQEPEPEFEHDRFSFDDSDGELNMEHVLKELKKLVGDLHADGVQQKQTIEDLKEREQLQERKLREAVRFVAPARKMSVLAPPPLIEEDQELQQTDESDEDKAAIVTKGRTTSDVRELFKMRTNFLSKKATESSALAMASSPSRAVQTIDESDEEGVDPSGSTPVRKPTRFVDVLKKRVAGSNAAMQHPPSPTRVSDDTSSFTTEEGELADDKPLPKGWTKRESRTVPGDYYYAHVSGWTSWEKPTEEMDLGTEDDVLQNGGDDMGDFYAMPAANTGSLAAVARAVASAEHDAAVQDGKEPAKKAKGWTFLRKKLLKPGVAANINAMPPLDQDDGGNEMDLKRDEF